MHILNFKGAPKQEKLDFTNFPSVIVNEFLGKDSRYFCQFFLLKYHTNLLMELLSPEGKHTHFQIQTRQSRRNSILSILMWYILWIFWWYRIQEYSLPRFSRTSVATSLMASVCPKGKQIHFQVQTSSKICPTVDSVIL